jgi:hypothetical protein
MPPSHHRASEVVAPEIVELLVLGAGAPLRVTAEVADAVWHKMYVKEPTLFVDVALADGGIARIRPAAVTGFVYRHGER